MHEVKIVNRGRAQRGQGNRLLRVKDETANRLAAKFDFPGMDRFCGT
jgi:hypothetical protein